MADTMPFRIGADASCSDGVCGEIIRVVVDPVARAVTHLVVEPKHRQGMGRLVPIDLVDATNSDVHLRCSQADFDKLDPAEETQFLPGAGGYEQYDAGQALYWPYYGLGPMGVGAGTGLGIESGLGLGLGNLSLPIVNDTLPPGEVGIRRGERVHATDGEIGSVQGLVIEPSNHHVTHVLLQEGHLWGRKEVAIPIGAVTRIDQGIQLNLTKEEVADLPAVDIDHPVG